MGQRSVLSTLQIRNYAIIDDVELSFAPGFTVFTGETGAGKSVIVDALSLALGGRSHSNLIRVGCEQCQITAAFSCNEGTKEHLLQLDLDTEDEIIVRRVITRGGSRCYLNDRQVTLNTIKAMASGLAAIQGQHAHRTLQSKDQHKLILDQCGNIDTAKIKSMYHHMRQISEQIEHLRADSGNTSNMELMHYQCDELDQVMPAAGEYEQLDQEHRQLAHSEQLLENCTKMMDRLQGEAGIIESGFVVARELRDMASLVPEFSDIAEQVDQATINLQEASREIKDKREGINMDPERLQQAELRLQALHELAHKHKVQPPQLPELHQQLKARLAQFSNMEETLGKLLEQQQQALAAYQQQDQELHRRRQKAASAMQARVTATLQELGMQKSSMTIEIKSSAQATASGSDDVEFYVQMNPGIPATPLRKTASGGELSRVCLAIHSHSPAQTGTGTIIFDEIDTGTGGDAAGKIGELLSGMSTQTQVFCITHQAQIAAIAEHHYKVEKMADRTTSIRVTKLDRQQREDEIARMLSGTKITQQSKEHAKQMLGALATESP